MNCVAGNVSSVERLPSGPQRPCFCFADMVFNQLQSAVPRLGKAPTIAGWLESKNRLACMPPTVLRLFSPQSPSLSLASSEKCKQEAVKCPLWSDGGNHTGSGDWTLLWSTGQLWMHCELLSLRNGVIVMSYCVGHRCCIKIKLCSCAGTFDVPLIKKRNRPQWGSVQDIKTQTGKI